MGTYWIIKILPAWSRITLLLFTLMYSQRLAAVDITGHPLAFQAK